MGKPFTCSKLFDDGHGGVRFEGSEQYQVNAVPALWLRATQVASKEWEEEKRGALVYADFGSLVDLAIAEDPAVVEFLQWDVTVAKLEEVSRLWRETDSVWQLPNDAIVPQTREYELVRQALSSLIFKNGISARLRSGLEIIPYPNTLEAHLWLSAAQSIRESHRFKKCERCDFFFPIQRIDARYCSSACKSKRD